MRKACLDCVYKHLASAAIADIEVRMGYPNLKLYVIGNLDHAAQEAAETHMELAMVIREHRLLWDNDRDRHHIPYEALCAYVETVARLPDDTKPPDLPDECCTGVQREGDKAQGPFLFSGDTRP